MKRKMKPMAWLRQRRWIRYPLRMTIDEQDRITRNHADAMYHVGDVAVFEIHIGQGTTDAQLCLSLDGHKVLLHQPLSERHVTIRQQLDVPGVLRCRVNGMRHNKPFSMLCAAAFDPEQITPTTTTPEDFHEFWAAQKTALAAVSPAPRLEPDPEAPTSHPDCSLQRIRLDHIDNSAVYGYVAQPTDSSGPLPAVLVLQNHGGGAWSVPREWVTDLAALGFLAMAINTHDVDNGLPAAEYERLNKGPLASYTLRGFMDRDEYYFRAPYLRVLRALDYLVDHPRWDGKSLILTGRSQGGGLSLVGAGLDPRVTGVVCAVPAMCEHGGPRFGRPAGWPRFVPTDEHDYGGDPNAPTVDGHGPLSDVVWQVSRYYDAVNFARRIHCPAVICLGLLDTCVPAMTALSAYNVLAGQRAVVISPDRGHDADRDPHYRRNERICAIATTAGSSLRT